MTRPERFKHEQIADSIRTAITDKTLLPGDRIPSLRETGKRHDVCVSTVLRAYMQLEAEGLLDAREKSGFFIAAGTEDSPAPRMQRTSGKPEKISTAGFITEVFNTHASAGLDTFTSGATDPALLPTAAIKRAMGRILRDRPDINALYENPSGSERLRKLIAWKFSDIGQAVKPADVIITNGAMHALALALETVAGPGATVAVETPVFPGTLALLAIKGCRILQIPSDPAHGLDLTAFEKAADRSSIACLITSPNFNNPTGSLMPDAAKEKLAALAGKFAIPVIEDDVFGALHFGPARPASIARFDRKGLVLHIGSFSKTLGAGLRTGYLITGRYGKKAARLKFSATLGTPALQQEAIAELMAARAYERHLAKLRYIFARNMAIVIPLLREYLPQARVSTPKGGFSLWVETPGQRDLLALAAQAMQNKLLFVPGEAFACGGLYKNYFRLCVGKEIRQETAKQAVKKLAGLLS